MMLKIIDDDGLIVPEFVRVETKPKIEVLIESYNDRQLRIRQIATLIYGKCRQRNPSRAYIESKLGKIGATNALMRSNKDVSDAMEDLRQMGKAWRDDGKTSPWLWVDESTGQPIDLG